jgi:hypothetical protein
LEEKKIGRKDTPFDSVVRTNMESAFAYLNKLLEEREMPFSKHNAGQMLALNNFVHYGGDKKLMAEYHKAIQANSERFYKRITPIADWYNRHEKRKDAAIKIASEVYVAIVGQPQLFIEGNHRTGSLIADWILLSEGLPPFVLSRENAIAYFAPSSEIKGFADSSTWRGKRRLPAYRNKFGTFLENHIDSKFIK